MNKRFTVLSAALCICVIAANIFEAKIFAAGPVTLTGGFLIFPISYIINDILSEIYGYKSTRFVILLAFCLNALFILATQIVRMLPPVPYCEAQPHLDFFFSWNARVCVASMAAFVCGSLLNSKIMAAMKRRQGENGFGWRAILSSLAGESVDSLIFFPIAFWGIGFTNMLTIMLTQVVLKTAYEIVVLPVTCKLVKWMKKSI